MAETRRTPLAIVYADVDIARSLTASRAPPRAPTWPHTERDSGMETTTRGPSRIHLNGAYSIAESYDLSSSYSSSASPSAAVDSAAAAPGLSEAHIRVLATRQPPEQLYHDAGCRPSGSCNVRSMMSAHAESTRFECTRPRSTLIQRPTRVADELASTNARGHIPYDRSTAFP